MHGYLKLLRKVRTQGVIRPDRTGVGTRSLFGEHYEVYCGTKFPILTTKRVAFKSLAEELLWMLRGEVNNRQLQARGVTIWDEWASENGSLGPIYGWQWRRFGAPWPGDDGAVVPQDGDCRGKLAPPAAICIEPVDQVRKLVEGIRRSPEGRRHIISAWNPLQVDQMALPPCHVLVQFHAEDEFGLSAQVYQRSADVFLGLPFNIASYALLLHLIGAATGRRPHRLVFALGDVHLYRNHEAQADLQLSRRHTALPRLLLAPEAVQACRELAWDRLAVSQLELVGYEPQAAIPAAVAV